MKKKFTLVLSALLMTGLVWDYSHQSAVSNGTAAPAGRTGSPGDGITCFTSCHGIQPGTASGNEMVSISGLPSGGYVAGTTYDLTITATESSISKFGFELAAQDASGNALGTLIAGSGSTLVGPGGAWLTHNPAGTSAGTQSWSFQWTAPSSGSGSVGFYYAVLFANGNSANSGDVMVTGNEMLSEASVGISEAELEAISVYPNPVIDEIHVAAVDVDEEIMITMFNMEGKKVLEEKREGGEIMIDLKTKSLNTGVYFLQLEVDGKITTKKLLIK